MNERHRKMPSEIDEDDVTQSVINEIYKEKMESDIDNEYTTCCSTRKTDKRLLLFSAQLAISLIILMFSSTMIAMKSENPMHVSLIASVLSFWLGKDPPQS